MASSEESMRSVVTFHRIAYASFRGTAGSRLGRLDVKKSDELQIRIDTPGNITSTSRGVIPHLTRDHVEKTKSITWVHVPFETFLERDPVIPTLVGGKNPLQTVVGLRDDRHLISMSLRDPHDAQEMPPNGNKFINANCIRGVRKMTPAQYRDLAQTCNPDIVIALSDIPFTPPPFSQKRITKSLERSAAWLAAMLHQSPEVSGESHHPSNILVQMVGDVSDAARRAFAASLTEKLFGKEAEQIKPFKCLDDGVLGYVFDLVPLRASVLASGDHAPQEDDEVAPNRRMIDSRPLTQPLSEVIVPKVIQLLRSSIEPLTPEKPRIVTGASSPHEVLHLIRDVGVDMFDVAWVQKAADWGIALDFVFPASEEGERIGKNVRADGKSDLGHNLYSSKYAKGFARLADCFIDGNSATEDAESVCPCIACSPISSSSTEIAQVTTDNLTLSHTATTSYDPPFSRAYLHHLLHTHEMSAHALLAAHNLAVADAFFTSVRAVLARGASHSDHSHPYAHARGTFRADLHPISGTFVSTDPDANFAAFEREVERFCATYDGSLRIFSEAKRDWISVDYARGKGRLAREKARQGEEDLATKPEGDEADAS